MWKFVSRGIRESLERRANCRTNVCSHTSQDGTTSNVAKYEVNHIYETPSINRSSIAQYFGIRRGIRAADPVSNGDRGSRFNPKYSWAEAIEWVRKLSYNCKLRIVIVIVIVGVYIITFSPVFWPLAG